MIFKDSVLQSSLNNILDTFSGSDGGISFIKFRMLLESLERQAEEGDVSAKQLIDIVKQFSRIISYAQKR